MVLVYLLMAVGLGMIGFAYMKKDSGKEMGHKMENFSVSLMQELERTNKRVDELQNEVEQVKSKEMKLQKQLKYEQKDRKSIAQ